MLFNSLLFLKNFFRGIPHSINYIISSFHKRSERSFQIAKFQMSSTSSYFWIIYSKIFLVSIFVSAKLLNLLNVEQWLDSWFFNGHFVVAESFQFTMSTSNYNRYYSNCFVLFLINKNTYSFPKSSYPSLFLFKSIQQKHLKSNDQIYNQYCHAVITNVYDSEVRQKQILFQVRAKLFSIVNVDALILIHCYKERSKYLSENHHYVCHFRNREN